MFHSSQTFTRRRALGVTAALGLSQFATEVAAQDVAVFALSLVAEGFDRPVFLADPNDESGRFFVVEQTGRIRILRNGELLPDPWLDLSGNVSGSSEQGLLGLALHPNFASNGIFFVHYTDLDGNTVVARYEQQSDKPDQVDMDSVFTVLTAEQPAPNHNGGMIVFGPDGYLYIGLGDGGNQGDPSGNGQNLGVLLGKILRLDVDTEPGEGGYIVPPDNPFVSDPDARGEIWATGLRNPWRFSFDRETNDLWIGDVGQNAFEEINREPAGTGGLNYGWSLAEGPVCYNDPDCESNELLTWPVFAYGRELGIAVSGGYVYRGTEVPDLAGKYLCGDYGTGYIWVLTEIGDGQYTALEPFPTDLVISSFAEDAAGEINVIDLNGSIYRIIAA